MIKKVFVLSNPKIKGIEKERAKIEGMLKNYGVSLEKTPDNADLILTMGGDGTFLKGIHLTNNPRTFVCGIKYGKVGFLTYSVQNIEENLKKILTGKVKTSKRILLEVIVKKEGKTIREFCFNEMVVFRKGVRIIDVTVSSQKEEIFGKLRCDGLIVSTPTGSTAHSFSAAGPVVSPDTECLLIVPVAPHSLCWRPVVVSSKEQVAVKVSPEALIVIDGQREIEIGASDNVIVKKSTKKVNIIMDDDGFFDRLKSKFHWGS
ncbi:MAG: NAD(+)/NADH kinase [Elusimicrobia bacterium]|nr:NAD(+)/NADH kinase [Elusimicrobiota bacterium]